MKIALVCPASLPATQFGGIVFLAVDIAREISELGHDVTIYTTDLDFSNGSNKFNKKLPRLEQLEKFKINRSHTWFSVKLFFFNPSIYKQLSADKPDIIHTIGLRSFQSIASWMISKKYKIPLVVSDQGGLTTHPDLKSGGIFKKILYKLQTPMIHFIINNSTKISVANEYEKKIFEKFNQTSKIEVIRNGINLEIMKTKTQNFKKKHGIVLPFVLFIGRFSKVKGIDILLHAIKILKDRYELENIRFVIMGVDFGFQNQMIQMIDDFDIKEKIHLIMNPSREDVIAAYSESEFLVLPSRWELSPLTPLEGFAFKKPVISTNVHGIPSTITDKKNGILVKNEDYHELAEAIMKLINDKQKCLEYGLSGYNLVKTECNSKSMTEKTLRMYNQIINR